MSSAQKDTIYVDIDDEITSIIDKVNSSSRKIVALVLPKRAAMLQSIVNMKLLKRTADDSKKKIVLITSEAGLLPLAGAVGLHVAKTLQSKPAVPPPPAQPDSNETPDESVDEDAKLDATKPVGVLAGLPDDTDETIEVDNSEEAPAEKPAKTKKPKNKKQRIPNFSKFRLRMVLGVMLLILLLVGWYVAAAVLPKAHITIKTDSENINSQFNFTARPGASDVNMEQSIVPAEVVELRKTDTEKAPATGQKNVGEKASGTVVIYNCSLGDLVIDRNQTVPAGTGISSGNLTYILAEDVVVEPSNHSSLTGNDCNRNRPSREVRVTAQNPGEQYNAGEKDYSVSGFSSMSASGSEMTGGTDKNVKIVSKQDVDSARERLLERNNDAALDEVKQKLADQGYFPLEDTLTASKPELAASPNVGDEAKEVTITATVVYTMVGVHRDDLKKLVEEYIADEIDTNHQAILNDGLESASFDVQGQEGNGDVRLSVATTVTAGPQIDEAALKEEIKGKKRGEVENMIKNRPGVRDVIVEYSPFWVAKAPGPEKVTIVFEGIEESDANNE